MLDVERYIAEEQQSQGLGEGRQTGENTTFDP
jgi:hypothetical protein